MSYQSSLQPITCSLSLSSCRLKAEAIARALNNRIWPTALISDSDERSEDDDDDEDLQVKTSLRGACAAVIDRAPQAHNIYDSKDKVIGHCWLNAMQTDDDEEYFDTHPCSSPPSPAEEEIIVNPPTHNGISPFYAEYDPHHRDEMPGYSNDNRIASGTKLFEKLQRYSESLSFPEDGTETFYDVSDYEDYDEKIVDIPPACERDRSINSKVSTQLTEEKAEQSKDECSEPGHTGNVDFWVKLNDINVTVSAENSSEDFEVSENAPADSIHNSSNELIMPDNTKVEGCNHAPDQEENSLSFSERIEHVRPDNINCCSEEDKSFPDIGIVPPTPLPSSTSFSSESTCSNDSLPPLPTDNEFHYLSTDFRLRRIQELEEEEDRPRLLRSTSLKTGKTPPGTPGIKKIVRFADALGLDLEAVRHIVQDDLPNVPSSAFTDLKLDGNATKVPPAPANRVTFPGSLWDPAAVPSVGSGTHSLIPQFQLPCTRPDFLDRVRNQCVCLESIVVSDLTLHCTCRVVNVSYEKFVAARYTINDWLTYEEVVASYVPNSSDGGYDKFSFSLFVRHLQPHQRLLFAIRYVVGGTEHWDNNCGQNYILRSHSNAPTLPSTADGLSWMHHFY